MVGNIVVEPGSGHLAMRKAIVNLVAKDENNLEINVNENGDYNIEIPENKYFITGGVVHVNLPVENVINVSDNQIDSCRTIFKNFSGIDFREDTNYNGFVGSLLIEPGPSHLAMRKAVVNLITKQEDNLEININDNGDYNIEIPENKDFITGGVVHVNIPIQDVRIIQTGIIFHWNQGQYVGTVNIEKATSYAGMKIASATVITNPEDNYQLNITSNGNHPIEIPTGKDFIIGGNVNVDVNVIISKIGIGLYTYNIGEGELVFENRSGGYSQFACEAGKTIIAIYNVEGNGSSVYDNYYKISAFSMKTTVTGGPSFDVGDHKILKIATINRNIDTFVLMNQNAKVVFECSKIQTQDYDVYHSPCINVGVDSMIKIKGIN